MLNTKTVQLITTSISTFTLTPSVCNLNASKARYLRISEIIRKDLIDQRRHLLHEIGSPSNLTCDLAASETIEAGDQNSNDPFTAPNPKLHALADAVNYECDAESSNLGRASRSP